MAESDQIPIPATLVATGEDTSGGFHATHTAIRGKGGLRTVADLAARDALVTDATNVNPPGIDRLEEGMIVWITALARYDRLNADLTTWTEGVLDGGTVPAPDPGPLFVNHSTGDDSNDGTAGNPLATAQEAIRRMYPQDGSFPTWTTERRIEIQSTDFEESITIPKRGGTGPLRIVGQQTTVQTVTESGALVAVANRVTRRTLNTVEAIAGPVADDCIAFPPSATSGFGNPFEDAFDYCPVVGIGANSVEIDSTLNTGFFYLPTASVNLNRPDSVWRPTPDNFFFGDQSCINNAGAPLIVEGFRFRPNAAAGQDKDYVINNDPGPVPAFVGSGMRIQVRGCIVEPDGARRLRRLATGSGIEFAGCIIRTTGFDRLATGYSDCLFMNCRFPDGLFLNATSGSMFEGVDVSGLFNMDNGTHLMRVTADFENLSIQNASSIEINRVSINGTQNGINAFANSSVDLSLATELIGSVSVRAVNLQGPLAVFRRGAVIPTLTGTVGDLFVGDLGPFDYTQDRQDIAKGCFFETNGVSTPTGFARVSGTPVDNQLAVWVDDETIEGDGTLTWDGAVLDADGAFNQGGIAAPAVSAAGEGRIYFDSTANVFRVSENGGAFSDLVNTATGNVSNTGTPADNEVAVWTDPTTIEGDGSFTWDGSVVDVDGAFNQGGIAAPAVSAAGEGRIYFDSTANVFRASENGAAYTNLIQPPGGNVSNTGTPADNQLAVWTDPTTVEGDANLTWDGAVFDIDGSWNQGGIAAPAVSGGGEGRVYFDSTANRFRVSENGGGYVDLVNAATGNVSNTGTPADNQLAVWTDPTTVEGDANLTWDGAILDIDGSWNQGGIAAPAVSPAGEGRVYFDSTANVFRVSENGGGYVDLVSAGGGGNVSNTGTPVDNQLAVWTDPTTVEGDANLTWDGTTVSVGGAAPPIPNAVLSSERAGAGTTVHTYLRNTSNNGFTAQYISNDRAGLTAFGTVLMYGSAAGSTLFGLSANDSLRITGDGANLNSVLIGAVPNVDVVIGQNNVPHFKLTSTQAVFNDDNNNYDFRVKGTTEDDLIVADASANRVGIGAIPTAPFDVGNALTFDPSNELLGIGITTPPFTGAKIAAEDLIAGQTVGSYLRNTSPTGFTAMYVVNDPGAFSAFGAHLIYGSATGNTLFGIAAANYYALTVGGASAAGMMIGSNDNVPVVIGQNNTRRIEFNGTETVLNETGVNHDVRIETPNETHAFFVDGNADMVGVVNPAPLSTLDVDGSTASAVTSIAVSQTLNDSHSTVLVDASGGVINVTLPLASSCPRREYRIKKTDATANAVSVSRSGSNLIDGLTSQSLASQYDSVTVVSDGSNWFVF